MANKNVNIDTLLRRTLGSTESPDPALVQKIKYKIIKEDPVVMNKPTIRRSFGAVAAAVMVFMLITTTAFAAWHFLKPSDVANTFENPALSAAFDSESAININKSVTSGEYTFTLLAIVSGKDISDHPIYSNGEIRSDRTYSVVAIQKTDGRPMPSPQDAEYGNPSFYVSPYVKGEKPWQINAHTLNGGYTETVVDGVMYRIIDCDNVTIFADRGVYLGVNTGSISNHAEAFIYSEQTGELKANPDYKGSSVVFDLPISITLANPEKAQAYLDALLPDGEVLPANAEEPNVDVDSSYWTAATDGKDVSNANEDLSGFGFDIEIGDGLLSKQVMTLSDYKEWMENQLAKAQEGIDRESLERCFEYFDNGHTITLYLYKDGSFVIQRN